jgi:hypothetical protein
VSTEPEIQAAAVVFRHDEHDRQALADFARELADSGLATGDRVTINQPSRSPPDGTGCTLDTAALADAGAPLRRALTNRPDLVVAEKFGEQEQSGAGLADDILAVMAEGLPILVLVPEPALAKWRELTGNETEEVPCEADALRRWWRDRFAGKS